MFLSSETGMIENFQKYRFYYSITTVNWLTSPIQRAILCPLNYDIYSTTFHF